MCVCLCVLVRGSNLFLSLCVSIFQSFNLFLSSNSTHSTALREKKKTEKVKATLSSSYAKSAEYSICKPGLAVQTKHDYISRLHVLPCPPFPIFPGEKIMWLGCVISLKLHTSDGPRECVHVCVLLVQYCMFAYLPVLCESVWASVGVSATNGSIGGERLAFGVGGPLICSATAEVG